MSKRYKFYRARFTFVDSDWAERGDPKIPNDYIVHAGTVVALDVEPAEEYWEELSLYTTHSEVIIAAYPIPEPTTHDEE
jgi:hypothetical protein